MGAQHTPGPWEPSDVQLDRVQCSARGEMICETRYASEKSASENFANARLIAAAPDLLAACEALLSLLEAPTMARMGFNKGGSADMARRAIARAKGETL